MKIYKIAMLLCIFMSMIHCKEDYNLRELRGRGSRSSSRSSYRSSSSSRSSYYASRSRYSGSRYGSYVAVVGGYYNGGYNSYYGSYYNNGGGSGAVGLYILLACCCGLGITTVWYLYCRDSSGSNVVENHDHGGTYEHESSEHIEEIEIIEEHVQEIPGYQPY